MNSHICMAHCVTSCTTLKTSKQKRLFLNPLSSSIQFTTQRHKELHQHKAGGTGTASATEHRGMLPAGNSGRSPRQAAAHPTARTPRWGTQTCTTTLLLLSIPYKHAGRLPVHKPPSLWELPFYTNISHSHPQVKISGSFDLDSWLTIEVIWSIHSQD